MTLACVDVDAAVKLSKPFTLEQLLEAIAIALGTNAPAI
jgi:hypothetical protein